MRLGVARALVDGLLVPGDVEVAEGVIRGVGLAPAGPRGTALPGLVDLQVNGVAGVDVLDAGADELRRAGEALAGQGVTAYQPTLITAPPAVTLAALAEVAAVAGERDRDGGKGAARVIGAHLEGPFLAPARMGTHPPAHRRDPDAGLLGRLLAAGPVTQVTLAPELPGALGLVDDLVARGVLVSVGHTDATAGEAAAAFDRGARTVTHLFNAMRPFRPRDPGVAGVALARPDVVVQVIVDGHHLAPETVQLVWRAAAGRCVLVTDAIAAAGMADGTWRLGEVEVRVVNGVARRADGTLAGSTLTLLGAVRNVVALGVPLPAAVDAATRLPADLVGRPDLGRLVPGGRADVLVVDEALELVDVLVGGGA